MIAHVLVVDDERKLADILSRYLETAGYGVTVLHDGNEVIDTVLREQIDIVLLDRSLPSIDGLALCQQLRALSDLPIIMITSRVEESDRIAGLEIGADDYICKPFSPREVVARVGANLRRRRPIPMKASQPLFIDEAMHTVLVNGTALDLTLVEYRMLKTLYTNPGKAFTRDELIDDIYEDNRIVSERTVDVHVKNLRHKLEIFGLVNVIATIHGLGYRWRKSDETNFAASRRTPDARPTIRHPDFALTTHPGIRQAVFSDLCGQPIGVSGIS